MPSLSSFLTEDVCLLLEQNKFPYNKKPPASANSLLNVALGIHRKVKGPREANCCLVTLPNRH